MSTSSLRGREQATVETPGPAAQRTAAPIELIATIALALSTLIAVTAVSIGIARADVFGAQADGSGETLAIALFVGLMLSGVGCLTAAITDDRNASGD
jgi:hypothetical protein